jgi:hypothetical protein
MSERAVGRSGGQRGIRVGGKEKLPQIIRMKASLLSLVMSVAACGGNDGGIQGPAPVEVVTVTAPSAEIRVGETVQLTATALDADGNVLERSFIWISGIGSVASVSQTGLVTGLQKGQSEIEAIAEDVAGSIVITVDPAPPLQ